MDEFPLHRAAVKGQLDKVRRLIEGGVSVDSRDNRGWTPLHWAAERGRCEVAKLLIDRGCDLNPKGKKYYADTPLWFAASRNNKDVVDLLIERGARLNCGGQTGKCTLLHTASREGWCDVVQRILEEGQADVNAAMWCGWDVEGMTPLMWAATAGQTNVAALLVQAGADISRKDARKNTALHMAAYHGSYGVVQVLLRKEGLNLHPRDITGATPLHKACMKERHDGSTREIVKQLLEAGADPNIKDFDDRTALGFYLSAVYIRHELKVIQLLVQHGAFFEESKNVCISHNKVLNECKVSLCTQSIVNKFHRQSLPALKSISYFSRQLPNVDKFQLSARQIAEVENLVKCEIKRKTFCDVVKVRPMALSALCVLSLITCQPGVK